MIAMLQRNAFLCEAFSSPDLSQKLRNMTEATKVKRMSPMAAGTVQMSMMSKRPSAICQIDPTMGTVLAAGTFRAAIRSVRAGMAVASALGGRGV